MGLPAFEEAFEVSAAQLRIEAAISQINGHFPLDKARAIMSEFRLSHGIGVHDEIPDSAASALEGVLHGEMTDCSCVQCTFDW